MECWGSRRSLRAHAERSTYIFDSGRRQWLACLRYFVIVKDGVCRFLHDLACLDETMIVGESRRRCHTQVRAGFVLLETLVRLLDVLAREQVAGGCRRAARARDQKGKKNERDKANHCE